MSALPQRGINMTFEEIQEVANEVVDSSLAVTRRMLSMSKESQDVGAKVLVKLDRDGVHLDLVELEMEKIKSDVLDTENQLKELEAHCCCCCHLFPCNRHQQGLESEDARKNNGERKVIQKQPQKMNVTTRIQNKNDVPGTSSQSGYIQKITNDAREDEMEYNMGQVSNIVGNLRNMAIDIRAEVEEQNNQIDRIIVGAEANEARISQATQRTAKLANS